MVISELIEELERLKDLHGDMEVEFQHCDDGGTYPGSEEIHNIDVEVRSITSDKETYIEKLIVIS